MAWEDRRSDNLRAAVAELDAYTPLPTAPATTGTAGSRFIGSITLRSTAAATTTGSSSRVSSSSHALHAYALRNNAAAATTTVSALQSSTRGSSGSASSSTLVRSASEGLQWEHEDLTSLRYV
jgi:hypothetical protein